MDQNKKIAILLIISTIIILIGTYVHFNYFEQQKILNEVEDPRIYEASKIACSLYGDNALLFKQDGVYYCDIRQGDKNIQNLKYVNLEILDIFGGNNGQRRNWEI